jgi:hypothetical protein
MPFSLRYLQKYKVHNKGEHGLGDFNVTNKHKTKQITFLYLDIYTKKTFSIVIICFPLVNVLVKLYLDTSTHVLGIGCNT